jgi:hypothetical protein
VATVSRSPSISTTMSPRTWRLAKAEFARTSRGGSTPATPSLTGEASAAVGTVLVLAAAVSLTVGEIWQSAGGWGLSYAYAPEDRRSAYLSVYNLGAAATSVVGPALLTWAVVNQEAPGWLGLAAAFVAVGAAVPAIVRRRPA